MGVVDLKRLRIRTGTLRNTPWTYLMVGGHIQSKIGIYNYSERS